MMLEGLGLQQYTPGLSTRHTSLHTHKHLRNTQKHEHTHSHGHTHENKNAHEAKSNNIYTPLYSLSLSLLFHRANMNVCDCLARCVCVLLAPSTLQTVCMCLPACMCAVLVGQL